MADNGGKSLTPYQERCIHEYHLDPATGERDYDKMADGTYKMGRSPEAKSTQFKSGNPGGGRPKGSKNKKTLRQELVDNGQLTPAQFLASVVNDENANINQRIRAAEASAKFYDPTLSSVEMHTDEEHVAPFNIILAGKPIDEQLDEVIEHLEDEDITKE